MALATKIIFKLQEVKDESKENEEEYCHQQQVLKQVDDKISRIAIDDEEINKLKSLLRETDATLEKTQKEKDAKLIDLKKRKIQHERNEKMTKRMEEAKLRDKEERDRLLLEQKEIANRKKKEERKSSKPSGNEASRWDELVAPTIVIKEEEVSDQNTENSVCSVIAAPPVTSSTKKFFKSRGTCEEPEIKKRVPVYASSRKSKNNEKKSVSY